jgi:4-amino-4-deoxy-L-arabinose transferase-like glycosyltransferase
MTSAAKQARPPRRQIEPIEIPPRTWTVWAISLSLFFALTRLLALRNSPLDLLPDEAQYWSWSRNLAFGYFSKPPVIAWLIRGTTELVGTNDEWAVRLGAPLMHAGTGIVLAFLGRALFSARAGFIAALLYTTLPGVVFSALIISTDVPLLFFWALALLALWQVLAKPDWRWAVVAGAAFGLGFLSKYAMSYFLLGLAVYAVIGPRDQFKAAWKHLLLALVVAAGIIVPNVIWNASHGWATVGHTAANANWGQGAGLHIVEALSFAAAQFGVFGPVLLVALIVRLALWRRDPPPVQERFLVAFAVPVLALMIVQSGISRAHANWAAVAYVPATVLIVGWLERLQRAWPIRLAIVLQLGAFIGFTLLFAGSLHVTLPKSVDIFHQMRGWKSLANLAWHRMATMPADASLAADDREVMAELDYNLRGRSFPLVMATGKGPPGNQYELENALNAENSAHVLLISRYRDRAEILDRFKEHKMTDQSTVSAGEGRKRDYFIYELAGFKGD